jgi:hypothetical protein
VFERPRRRLQSRIYAAFACRATCSKLCADRWWHSSTIR